MNKISIIAGITASLICGGVHAATLNATDSVPAFNTSQQVSTQYRNGRGGTSGAGEVYVAPDGDAGNGTPRAEGQFAWTLNDSIDFLFSYDSDGGVGGQGLLTSTLGGVSAVFGDIASEIVFSGLSFNALQLNVEDRDNGNEQLTVTDLIINGMEVNTGPFGDIDAFADYGVTGFGPVSDFTVTGSIFRSGSIAGTQQSRPRVDLVMGSIDVAPVPLPAAAWLLMASLGGLGAVAARRRNAA